MTAIEIISTAFVMGLVGSLHCIGMCGPLALALPIAHKNNAGRLWGGVVYNLGRVLTYAFLGFLLGLAGELIFSSKVQSILSVSFGVLILLFLLLPHRFKSSSGFQSIANRPMMKLRSALSKLLFIPNYRSLFGIGMLNGLLPCGLVYLAITASFLTGTAMEGSIYMAFFGLGTFPAMLAAIYFGSYLNQQLRLRIRRVVPVFMTLMAVLLVLRGLNLGIPYLSPMAPTETVAVGAGCH